MQRWIYGVCAGLMAVTAWGWIGGDRAYFDKKYGDPVVEPVYNTIRDYQVFYMDGKVEVWALFLDERCARLEFVGRPNILTLEKAAELLDQFSIGEGWTQPFHKGKNEAGDDVYVWRLKGEATKAQMTVTDKPRKDNKLIVIGAEWILWRGDQF